MPAAMIVLGPINYHFPHSQKMRSHFGINNDEGFSLKQQYETFFMFLRDKAFPEECQSR